MNKITLGRTNIEVSELCFGALPIGPLQKNVPIEEGADIIAHALESGITFVDTAQMYKTYEMIEGAMKKTGKRPIISTKSTAATYEDMEKAIKEALEKLDIDYIDIFLLHAARVGADVFEVRAGAWECLKDYKAKGIIKAIGGSFHSVLAVNAAAQNEECDIVFPLVNKSGMGVMHGSCEDMEKAVELCFKKNKGVFFMKLFAGGVYLNDYKAAVEYGKNLSKGRASYAVGMITKQEVDMNLKYFTGESVDDEINALKSYSKSFFVADFLCKSCGFCLEQCAADAIYQGDKHAIIESDKCVRCGYCVGECPEFAIRMV
ncbi:MAG: aldo/keto reductase [Defluviitaleaceae bacterium]|nr:aldo/keto reductase [Defluviitaleaceae bacterium]